MHSVKTIYSSTILLNHNSFYLSVEYLQIFQVNIMLCYLHRFFSGKKVDYGVLWSDNRVRVRGIQIWAHNIQCEEIRGHVGK